MIKLNLLNNYVRLQKPLFFLVLAFSLHFSAMAQNGCTDPLASNYDPAAVNNDGSCVYLNATITQSNANNPTQLDSSLNENSGLIIWDNEIWTHLDGGNPTNLYNLDITDLSAFSTLDLSFSNIDNEDWEDIAQDEDYIYIGDFGNNANGNRTDLKIYRLSKTSIEAGSPIIDEINFSYIDQVDFSPQGGNNTDFDCEAMLVTDSNIYLFTKEWVSEETTIYTIPKTPGTYIATNEGSYDVNGLVTGATYVEDEQLVVLSGYEIFNFLGSKIPTAPFIFLLYDFQANDFFSGNKRKIFIDSNYPQVEGIAHQDGLNYFVSNEESGGIIQPFIYRYNLADYLGNYLGLNSTTNQFAWIAEFDNNFNSTRLFEDAGFGNTKTLTIQATSSDDEYVVYYDNFNHKWQDDLSPLDSEYALFYGNNLLPNSTLNSPATIGNYYTIQIEGFGLSNRRAIIMETDNLPVDFDDEVPVTPNNPAVYENIDLDLTINLNANKSPQERVFVRYTDDNYANSQVAEVTFANPTASTGTATIPAAFHTLGKNVSFYVYTTTIGATSFSNHDLIAIKLANNSGSNYSYTVLSCCATAQNGNFNDPATWLTGSVPPSGADIFIRHQVDLNQNYEANSVSVDSGASLSNSGFQLDIRNNGSLVNDGTFAFASGEINFLGTASITGTSPISLFDVSLQSGGVDFGSSTTITNNLTINSSGFVNGGSPIYGNASTLIYNLGGTFNRTSEWSNANSNQGNPHHVRISNDTQLNLGTENQGNPANISGDLFIENGSTLDLNAVSAMRSDLVIGGNLTNDGTLNASNYSIFNDNSDIIVQGNLVNSSTGIFNMSSTFGNDIRVEGDFTADESGSFNFNNRALFFEGGNTQNLTAIDDFDIPFLILNKTAGEVVIQQDILVSGVAGPAINMSDNSLLNLNDYQFQIGNGGDSQVSMTGNSAIKGSENSRIVFNSTSNLASNILQFSQNDNENYLSEFEMEGSGSVSLTDTLNISRQFILKNGTFNSDSHLTLKSSDAFTAIIPEVIGGNISGTVRVERHFPQSNRAFRYVSSPVTTSTTINENWQEGVNNMGTNFPADNINPNPGFGTHITGSVGGTNGFDATQTGNPSLYSFDETNQSQPWTAIANTDNTTLVAGTPYALMMRGDRSADLNSNNALGNATTLRTLGTIVTGNQTNNSTVNASEFVLVGNPYQAQVDMNDILDNHSTGYNTNFMYIFDPTIGTIGGYATVDLSDGSNVAEDLFTSTPATSNANQFLQPFQAALFEANATSPSITFVETAKTDVTSNLGTFYDDVLNSDELQIELIDMEHQVLVDAVKFEFAPSYSVPKSYEDATKLFNTSERLAIVNDSDYLSIEKRPLPLIETSIPLFTSNYQVTQYQFKLRLGDIADEETVALLDTYTNTLFMLSEGENAYNFVIDTNVVDSIATDRFELVFNSTNLSVDSEVNETFRVYPNPTTGIVFLEFSKGGLEKNIELRCFDLTGRLVLQHNLEQIEIVHSLDLSHLSNGIYLLEVKTLRRLETYKIKVRK